MTVRSVAGAVLLLGCLTSLAAAQETGTLVGRVVDQTGGVLPGVTIELATSDTAAIAVQSDAMGRYRFDGVTTRSAALTFRLINFAVLRRTVAIASGATTTVDAVMTLSLDADVVVTAAATFRSIADVEISMCRSHVRASRMMTQRATGSLGHSIA
jgi:hypothetical protein